MIRVRFSVSAGAANWSDAGRTYIVYDKQPNAATSSFSDIFSTAGGADAGNAFKNTLINSERYVILKTQPWDCAYNGDQTKTYEMFVKVPPKYQKTIYPGSATTEAQTGAWLFCYGANRNTTTNTTMVANFKMQFIDN